VRLAFAVAAHLEPEILIVDEVLAVGDVEFQKKCLGKMSQVARNGRTVLFVSHNMTAIQRLSLRALLIHRGRLEKEGDTPTVINAFLSSDAAPRIGWREVRNIPRVVPINGAAVMCKMRMHDAENIRFNADIIFDIRVIIVDPVDRIRVSFTVYDAGGAPIGTGFSNEVVVSKGQEVITLTTRISSLNLAPGHYYLAVAIGRGNHRSRWVNYDAILNCMHFTAAPEFDPDGMLPVWERAWGSVVLDNVNTQISFETETEMDSSMKTSIARTGSSSLT
jgi:lipopolysaccharide transport system ATP-binding protein